MRRVAKTAVEGLLSSTLAAVLSHGRRRSGRLVLAYHDVLPSSVPPDFGERSLHIPEAVFDDHLDAITKSDLEVASLADYFEDRPNPRIFITFDDACSGAVNCALPRLADRRIPATVFVAPGMLGSPGPWWDLLADVESGVLAPDFRNFSLNTLGGQEGRILEEARARRMPVQMPNPGTRIAFAEEISAVAAIHPGLTLGAHSWSHPNLGGLSASDLHRELYDPLHWLRERWGARVLPWLAYPYGLETEVVRRAAADVGYIGGLLIRGGWHRRVPDALGIPRLNVSAGLSLPGFRARLLGTLE